MGFNYFFWSVIKRDVATITKFFWSFLLVLKREDEEWRVERMDSCVEW